MNEFIFLIKTVKDTLNQANLLHSIIKSKWDKIIIYISYIDETVENYSIKDDKYILINSKYNLYIVINELQCNIKGVFTCSYLLLPNFNHINKLMKNIIDNEIDFLSRGKENKDLLFTYMSNKSVKILSKATNNVNVIDFLSENNIQLTTIEMYSYHYNDNISIMNLDDRIKKLFILVFAGLGNQLFQVSTGYSMAKKNNMYLILLHTNNRYDYGHNTNLFEFSNTIFKDLIYISEINKSYCDIIEINKEYTPTIYYPDIIVPNKNIFLKGYYQNEKYFNEYKDDLINIFKDNIINDKLYNLYSDLHNSYFIHYRRGDYVGVTGLTINYDKYFKLSIEYILNIDPIAHFYILSNDIKYCKNYPILNNINKTFVENLNTLETLFFMSLCKKGGICSNSSFSWWGSYLNNNLDKKIIFPSIWFDQKKDENIYRDDCVIIEASL